MSQDFRKTLIKLTAIYTSILFLICLGFSIAVYLSSVRDFRADRPRPAITFELRPEVETFIRERDRLIQTEILTRLVIVNLLVLTGGAVLSYFLARWTLKPIYNNLERQLLFVSSASHELKTPLAAMQMENEVTLRNKTSTKTDLLDQVKSNLEEIDKLKGLIDRLLQLSSDESLELSDLELKPIVDEAMAPLKSVAKTKKIELINQLATTTWSTNATALTELLTILLDNAIKYSPDQSTVMVGVENGKLFVRDQGCGITKEDLPHIFDRFYRADAARTSEGYGLGLALAQNLAIKLNLQLTAQNNSDQGSTFWLETKK